MTKKEVVDKLMSLYMAEEKWRDFFEKTVDELNGEGKIVTEETYNNIRKYIANLT